MTNKDKFLKDGVSVEEFATTLTKKISRWDELSYYSEGIEKDIIDFLNEPIKPTLTEDERVILRNIPKEYEKIGRIEDGEILYLEYKYTRDMDFDDYFHTPFIGIFIIGL